MRRIRPRARGESSLGCGSGCAAEDLIAPVEDPFARAGESDVGAGNSMLRPADLCSRAGIALAAGESPARRRIRLLPPASHSLRGAFGSFSGPRACSDARLLSSESKMPAVEFVRRRQEPECRLRRRLVRSAFDPLAPEPDSWPREPIRRLPNPICRLRVGFVGSGARMREPFKADKMIVAKAAPLGAPAYAGHRSQPRSIFHVILTACSGQSSSRRLTPIGTLSPREGHT